MATGQTDRELLLALMRNPGVIPNLDPFTYPQNAPNVPKEFGQEVLEFAQALERNPNRRATGLEEVVELIGKMGVINPLKTAGSLMQLDKPTVERMAQSGVEAAKRAYDDPPGTASRLAQGAKEALLDPVGTAGELSVSDVAGGSGLLSKLAGAANLTGPALMAAMVPGSDVPRPKPEIKDPTKTEKNLVQKTDLGQIAATFKAKDRPIKTFEPGSRVVDFGGGKADKAKDFMAEQNVELLVIDPFNRSASHNSAMRKELENKLADYGTINNVLNVIEDPDLRKNALLDLSTLTKPNAPIIIKIHTGNRTGKGGLSQSGTWQENRKTETYLEEVQQVFPDAQKVAGDYIVATNALPLLGKKKTRSEELMQEQLDFGEEKKDAINLLKENPNNPIDPFKFPAKAIPEAAPLRTQSWPTGSGKNGEIRVLSLFDGLGGARVAFNNLDAPVEYIASEIDPYAIKVHKNNFPDTKHIGDVTKISGENLGPIDVLVGGSPCQDLSVGKAGRMGLEGPNSKLFYDYVRMLEETNPKYFIFENVASMKPSVKEEITKIFGVEPIMIDAKDVSAQNRKRYFWTNIPVDLPKNKNIKIQDVLEQNVDPKYYHTQKAIDYMNRKVRDGKTRLDAFGHHTDIRKQDKSRTLTANLRKGVPYNVLIDESGRMRKFTPTEVERLAGVPEGYTEGVSNTQRYKMLGNGFQIQVMEHILSNIPKGE